ncbi:protein kinase [bacterium]|nr:protein kinase [bacterium]MBP9808038.1 protein kinase [bacterium]
MPSLCKTCGKPPLANRAGSVTSYFFQHNYCQCHSEKSALGREVKALIGSKKNDDPVCANCGKSRPSARRAGSFTAFLFKELRCSCAGPHSKPAPNLAQGGKGNNANSSLSSNSRGCTKIRSRTAARIAQRKQFTEILRKAKVSGDFNAGTVFQPGSVIGGAFRIQSMIGQGGMGVVYLAEQISLKKQVALKILAPELVNEQSWLRFKAEAKTLASLNHSSLVKVYDLGIHENTIPYYSMDFLQGQSLEEILVKDGPLPLKLALAIFVEVLDGLAYAHRNGIVHRDLKPGNIMLCTVDGAQAVKILDFGISKLIGPHAASSQSLTAVGEIFGSPFYMSPEQCSGGTVDARSDIYSVGCTLVEVLTGFVPFEGEEFIETVMMHQEDSPPLLCDLSAELRYPASLDLVLAKCLAKRPQERYQSAKELALDLVRVLEGKEVMAPGLVSSQQSDSSCATEAEDKTVHLPVLPILCACCVAIVLVAVSAYFIFRPTPVVDYSPRLRNAASRDVAVDYGATPQSNKTEVSALSSRRRFALNASRKATAASRDSDTAAVSALGFSPSSSDFKTSSKVAAVRRGGDTAADSALFEVMPEFDSSSLEPKGSEKETFKYSTIVVKNGQRLRRFNFPTDITIGVVRVGKYSERQYARGVIDVPADAAITFTPSADLSRSPQYLQRFRSDDITSLVLMAETCSDRVLAAAADISGITELRLTDAGELTEKGLQSLVRFKQLNSFALSSSALTGESIARANCWQNLKRLTWRDSRQPGAFLKKLQSSSSLAHLDLSASKLGHSDFLLISKLIGLERVILANSRITIEDLEAVAGLPKLTDLDLTNSGLGVKAIPILQKMKSLRQLAILQSTSSPEIRTKLINQLPNVKVTGWSGAMRVPSDY